MPQPIRGWKPKSTSRLNLITWKEVSPLGKVYFSKGLITVPKKQISSELGVETKYRNFLLMFTN